MIPLFLRAFSEIGCRCMSYIYLRCSWRKDIMRDRAWLDDLRCFGLSGEIIYLYKSISLSFHITTTQQYFSCLLLLFFLSLTSNEFYTNTVIYTHVRNKKQKKPKKNSTLQLTWKFVTVRRNRESLGRMRISQREKRQIKKKRRGYENEEQREEDSRWALRDGEDSSTGGIYYLALRMLQPVVRIKKKQIKKQKKEKKMRRGWRKRTWMRYT